MKSAAYSAAHSAMTAGEGGAGKHKSGSKNCDFESVHLSVPFVCSGDRMIACR
jgi:hypothetical protein